MAATNDSASGFHRNVDKVMAAGRALGIDVQPHSFPQGAKTAQDAADAIGVAVGQIVKSLIFGLKGVAEGEAGATDGSAEPELVLAYVSGSNQLDEKKLAAAARARKCTRVDADAVRSSTGFPIGGVPPFGHDNPLRVFVDPDLLEYDEVWASAGTWNDVFPLAPSDLVRASGGAVVALRRD